MNTSRYVLNSVPLRNSQPSVIWRYEPVARHHGVDRTRLRDPSASGGFELLNKPRGLGGAPAVCLAPAEVTDSDLVHAVAQMHRLLRRRQRNNPKDLGADDDGWAFPSRNLRGQVTHVKEVKEQRYAKRGPAERRKKVGFLPTPHRLRDTFVAACVESGVGMVEIKALVNHSLPGSSNDVTAGYYRPSIEHLRAAVERTMTFSPKPGPPPALLFS